MATFVTTVFVLRNYASPVMAFESMEDASFQARLLGIDDEDMVEVPLYISSGLEARHE